MDDGAIALLAAGIPAAVAAITFAATQVIAVIGAARERKMAALSRLLESLESIPRFLMRPWIGRLWRSPIIDVASSGLRLITVLPRRDRILLDYVTAQIMQMVNSSDPAQQTRLSGEMTAVILLHVRNSRSARHHLRRTLERGDWSVSNPADA